MFKKNPKDERFLYENSQSAGRFLQGAGKVLYYSVTVGILQSSWQVLKPRFYKALSYFIFHTLFSLKASRFFFQIPKLGMEILVL